MSRAAALALCVAVLAGCGSDARSMAVTTCGQDSECAGGEVCFPDGCGDPGKDLAVEVIAESSSGEHAQDFRIFELKAAQDLELLGPSLLAGAITRPPSGVVDPTQGLPYSQPISLFVSGESALIPGRVRTYEATVTPEPQSGGYSVAVGSGLFTVQAAPQDLSIPPVLHLGASVLPGESSRVDLRLPGTAALVRVDGQLLAEVGRLLTVPMKVQALSSTDRRSLSQVATVQTNGAFTLYVSPPSAAQTFLIRAFPTEAASYVPEKFFTVAVQGPRPSVFEMGNYGSPVSVSGQLRGKDGTLLQGVTLLVEGEVTGGGHWRSKATTTGSCPSEGACPEAGRFILQVLPNAADRVFTLLAFPPPESPHGILRTRVEVKPGGGDLGAFTAPYRVAVSGQLRPPEGFSAGNVRVVAQPLEALDQLPVPLSPSRTQTDAEGRYTLYLDPAFYRLDFLPSETLPRVSRFATIVADPGPGGASFRPVDLPTFSLANGRKVTGVVNRRGITRNGLSVAPYATVRYFRLISVEGAASSVLLAEGVSDATGRYSVTLPTR